MLAVSYDGQIQQFFLNNMIFEKNKKRRLYLLMEQYLLNRITARIFCDEFYYCYDLDLDSNTLNEQEQKAFKELAIVTNRFSEFKEDHEKYPGTYFDEAKLKKKIIETNDILKLLQ